MPVTVTHCFGANILSRMPLMTLLLVGAVGIAIQLHVWIWKKQTTNCFNPFPHLVKSAGLCRCEVEIGEGNDGLEEKLRQHAEAERLLGDRQPCGRLPAHADTSYWCHSLDSFVVKVVTGELGREDATVVPLPDINLIHIAV